MAGGSLDKKWAFSGHLFYLDGNGCGPLYSLVPRLFRRGDRPNNTFKKDIYLSENHYFCVKYRKHV